MSDRKRTGKTALVEFDSKQASAQPVEDSNVMLFEAMTGSVPCSGSGVNLLYNLKEDIGETRNAASDHSEVVESLLKQLDFANYHDTIGRNSRRKNQEG